MVNKLLSLRESKGWSQEYVANKLNISQPAYSKLESNQTQLTLERAKDIANLFEIPPEYFLSADYSVNHYNIGRGSNSHTGIITTYNNGVTNKDLAIERLLLEKDNQINYLQTQLKEANKEKDRLLQLLEKLSEKI